MPVDSDATTSMALAWGAASAARSPPATADGELLLLHCSPRTLPQPLRFALLPDDEVSSSSPKPTNKLANNLTLASSWLVQAQGSCYVDATQTLQRLHHDRPCSVLAPASSSCKAFRHHSHAADLRPVRSPRPHQSPSSPAQCFSGLEFKIDCLPFLGPSRTRRHGVGFEPSHE